MAEQNHDLREALLANLKDLAIRLMPKAGEPLEVGPGVHIAHMDRRVASNHCFNVPLAALTIQGRKIIQAGSHELVLHDGSLLVTCVDMPSLSSILEASPERPFLGIIVYLDRKILAEESDAFYAEPVRGSQSAWVEDAEIEYLDLFRRFANAAKDSRQGDLFLPLLMRELHRRLLANPNGALLGSLYRQGGRDSRISKVIEWLRGNVATPASMTYLARMANMSVSSFHRHFKEITGASPLQYQKQLRLYEAQRLMLGEDQRAAEAAISVGYESATQFSREYRRMFGESPTRDIERRRRRLTG